MKLAIIDNGVNMHHPALKGNWVVVGDLALRERACDMSADDHATLCMKILLKYAPGCREVHSIKILDDETSKGDMVKLARALHWCADNEVGLIHMSVGSTTYTDFDEIRGCIDRLCAQGTFIIAANSNRGVMTYPAYDSRVIGVERCPSLRDGQYEYHPSALNGIQYRASSVHLLRDGQKPIITPVSNSFAAPLITAKAYNILCGRHITGLEELHSYLAEESCNGEDADSVRDAGFPRLPSEEHSCPVVLLTEFESAELLRLLGDLHGMFSSDGYYCRASLDAGASSGIRKFEPVPVKADLNRYINWACLFFQCDILLVGLSGAAPAQLQPDTVDIAVKGTAGCGYERQYGVPPEAVINYAGEAAGLYSELIRMLTVP